MDPELEPDFAQATAGFTLIELLIAVAVLAVLALGATLALPAGVSRAQSDMAQFQRQFQSMRQLAITGQHTRGLAVTPRDLRQARKTLEGWQLSDRALRWRGRVSLAVHAPAPRARAPRAPERSRSGRTPEILFLANGRTSAFEITFQPRSGQPQSDQNWSGQNRSGQNRSGGRLTRCRSDGWTGLICGAS